jgi:hypothetical protein
MRSIRVLKNGSLKAAYASIAPYLVRPQGLPAFDHVSAEDLR